MEEGFPQGLLIPRENWERMVREMIERRKQSPGSWNVQIMHAWPEKEWPTNPNPPTKGTDYCWKPDDHV